MSYPEDFIFEIFNVCGFLAEVGFSDYCWEADFVVSCGIMQFSKEAGDMFAYFISVG